jgi:hypothetical protein
MSIIGVWQEKETVEALELLLPIVLELIDGICLSQTCVCLLVDMCLRWLWKLCPSGNIPTVTDELTQQRSVAVSLIELLRYLLLVVPDTFVALDCFPLPPCICQAGKSQALPEVSLVLPDNIDRNVQPVPDSESMGMKELSGATVVAGNQSYCQCEVVVGEAVDSIQQRAASLARAVNPVLLRNNEGKVVQSLDKALNGGDIAGAYCCVYEEAFCSVDNLPAKWQREVVSASAFSLSGPMDPSELFGVWFLCEWAVCDFRDSRGIVTTKVKRRQTAFRDMSRVYMAVSVLRTRMVEIEHKRSSLGSSMQKRAATFPLQAHTKREKGKTRSLGTMTTEGSGIQACRTVFEASKHHLSPGWMHDLIYAWLDQHDLWRGDTSERLPVLLAELVREGLFQPDAYVRQLLCNGVVNLESTTVDRVRVARHRYILQNLPSPPGFNLHDGIAIDPSLSEAYQLYQNEWRSALYVLGNQLNLVPQVPMLAAWQVHKGGSRNCARMQSSGLHQTTEEIFHRSKSHRWKRKSAELKQLVATCLQLPETCVAADIKPLETKTSRGMVNSLKRPAALAFNSKERDPTPGCEECSKSKQLKTVESKGFIVAAVGDEEDTWWLKRGPKVVVEAVKVELLAKPLVKQSRGRPKAVRKTQSLAQLAATHIESNQGASSSHLFGPKVSCPHHQPAPDAVNILQAKESNKVQKTGNLHSIVAAMKRLRVGENRLIISWLDSLVRSLVSSGGYCNPGMQANEFPNPASVFKQESVLQWRLREEQLAIIVFVMDTGNDLYSLLHFLLWLLPIATTSPVNPPGHVGRRVGVLTGNKESCMCDVGEAMILSCLRR